jgi:nitroimidazol reductase NimA-like FMN-containing flavoprotein (pyridoxamine 5'-phosphate oxidase superfamily)
MVVVAGARPVKEVEMVQSNGIGGLEPLEQRDCLRLLSGSAIGRVAFVVRGRPQALPVNYAVDAEGAVVFRTTPRSILTAIDGQPVVFEVDGFDARLRTGWSVCVHGVGRDISETQDEAAERLRRLELITWAPGRRDRWFAVVPEAMTGRRLPLVASAADFGWVPGVVG